MALKQMFFKLQKLCQKQDDFNVYQHNYLSAKMVLTISLITFSTF